MFTWVNNNISEELRLGLDYVLVSYYEDDCEDVILTQNEWQSVFDSLHVIFPNSKLGIGECGTTNASKKAEYMNRYYNMEISTPNYIGGYFWWYYKSDSDVDCVPKTKELWSTLNTISCNWATVTSTNKELTTLNRIKTYPNPVKEAFTIDLSEHHNVTSATLRTIHGQLCQSKKHDGSNKMSFEIDGPAGLYLLEIITSEGSSQTMKILKQY